jgi:hypothetical protein
VKDPVFGELKEYVLTEAEVAQKRTVYESEVTSEAASEEDFLGAVMASTLGADVPTKASGAKPTTKNPATTTKKTTSANDGGVADHAKKFDAMTLMLESMIASHRNALVGSRASAATMVQTAPPTRDLRCVWCDNPEHSRTGCSELSAILRRGQLHLNE